MKGKYLIKTDAWFIAPDGRQYSAVFGNVEIVEDTFLGIKTNARSSNWYAKVGSEENHMIVAGCQIHYATKCESVNTNPAPDWSADANGLTEYMAPCKIYIPEPKDNETV